MNARRLELFKVCQSCIQLFLGLLEVCLLGLKTPFLVRLLSSQMFDLSFLV